MNIYLAEKLKSLRSEKNVSQEKLAQYLKVSFQAVSKWESGNTYPDISLLPEIARFFGVTVDELLCVEKIDEVRLYNEYERKAEELYRNGKIEETLPIWLEAYKKMPNNTEVKESLMSTYFDIDKIKYQKEIIKLGTELYNSDVSENCKGSVMYYKGQAIEEISKTYAINGNLDMADKWASKSYMIHHSQEFLYTDFTHGKELISYFRFVNYWYFNKLFYMACRIDSDETNPNGLRYKHNVFKSVAKLYEVLYENDDMSFESLRMLYQMHEHIAELEVELDNNESVIKAHLNRALECVIKSMNVKEHDLTHPLLYGWYVAAAPSDNKQWLREMKIDISSKIFDSYRNTEWFIKIENKLNGYLE